MTPISNGVKGWGSSRTNDDYIKTVRITNNGAGIFFAP